MQMLTLRLGFKTVQSCLVKDLARTHYYVHLHTVFGLVISDVDYMGYLYWVTN